MFETFVIPFIVILQSRTGSFPLVAVQLKLMLVWLVSSPFSGWCRVTFGLMTSSRLICMLLFWSPQSVNPVVSKAWQFQA